MSLDFRESYPVIQWDLNRRILQKHYIGSVGDSGNGYKVMILQDGDILTPTTEEVYFYFEKHDKTHGYIKAEIIDNMFIVDLTNQVFAVAGNVSCNFQIKSGTRWKTSPEFIIKVDKNNIQDSIESSDDFIAFQEAINNLATITDSAITATENAIEATNLANDTVDTINNETLIIYKPYVANYDAIATTYPTPELGWTTQANDSGTRWRWNGTEWTNIGVFSNDKVGDVTQLYTTAKQSIVASINEVGTQLAQIETEKADKTTTNNIQAQLNTLVLESGSSPTEIVQQRVDSLGNVFSVSKERLDNVENIVLNGISKVLPSDWVSGKITNGVNEEPSSTRIRTGYHKFESSDFITIEPASGYKFIAHVYDDLYNFVIGVGIDSWTTTKKTIQLSNKYNIVRFMLAKTDDSVITTSESVNLNITRSLVPYKVNKLIAETNNKIDAKVNLTEQLKTNYDIVRNMSDWGTRHNTSRKLHKYVIPDSDFNNIPLTILTDGRNFTTNFDITKFKYKGGTTYYVDPVLGKDGNPGRTENTAFYSVYKALQVCSDGDTIILLDGLYTRSNWTQDGYIEKSVNIIAKNAGKVIVKNGNNHTYELYAPYTKTYYTSRNIVIKAVQKIGNETTELTAVNSIESVENTEGSFYCDGTNTYVHLYGDEAPNDDNCFLLLQTNKALVHTLCTDENVTLYLEGIDFIGGNPSTVLFSASNTYTAPKLYAYNCRFKHAYDATQSKDAVSILGATAIFVKCEASFSNKDGFNYHQYNGIVSYGIEIDCIGKCNGYGNTGDPYNNGSTAHDGYKVIRINGIYHDNYGANVADVHVNTKSLNLGCVAFDSTADQSNNACADFAAQQSGTTMYLDNCRAFGSKYNLYCADGAAMYVKKCEYSTKNSNGTWHIE
jgi:hypothetical protein